MSKLAIGRAQALVDQHRLTTGLEGDDLVIFWHVIFDMLEWCDSKRIDFDCVLPEVRVEYQGSDG